MTEQRQRVLHVILKVQPTNGQYNEHCLPLADERRITICSFLPTTLDPPKTIRLFAGDGTLRGGWQALGKALAVEDHDVVHVHAPQTGAIYIVKGLQSRGLRNAVYTVQNSHGNYRRRNRMLMVPIFLAYPRVVFCSEAAWESMPRHLRWLARAKHHIVPNAVDLSAIDRALSDVTDDHQGFRVGFLSRLIPIKNPQTVLAAVAACDVPGTELVVVGDGELRSELEDLADGESLRGRVTFTGMVERNEVYRHMAAADVCVSASRGEGLPVAVLEAMACGCPVVLSDIAPHREIAAGTAFIPLVDPDDVAGFTREIQRIANLSPAERATLGSDCRQIVERRYSLKAMHEKYVPIYAAAARAVRQAPRHPLRRLSR
jgi:glycosyltransferase involved in cell wall biosynthesis